MFRASIFGGPIALSVLLASALPGVAAPSTPGAPAVPLAWSSPVNVVTGQFFDVSTAVDSTGAVHIAAAGRNGLWYITNRTGTWVAKRILVNPTSKSYKEPSIALNANDRVFIAFSRTSCNDCVPGSTDGIYLLTDRGRSRGTFAATPTKIAPPTSAEPSLVAVGGHVFFAYQSDCCHPGPLPPLWFKTNVTGSWTVAQIAPKGDSPSLQLGSNGRARVAYTKPTGIGFATATTSTGSFGRITVPGTGAGDHSPLLTLGASNQPHILWIHDNLASADVLYATRVSGSWSAPANVTTSANLSSIGFTLDGLGRPAAAIGTDPGRVRVARLVGGVWIKTTISTADPLDVAIARGGGHLGVVYARDGGGIFVSIN